MAIRQSARDVSRQTDREYYDSRPKRGSRLWSLRYKPTTDPVKFHPCKPETLYEDPYNKGNTFPWKRRRFHYIPWANNGKGGVIECAGEHCVVCAYMDPQRMGVDIEPDSRIRKNCWVKISYAVSGWIEEWFHLVERQSKNDKDKTYRVRELCTGRGCEHCANKIPRVFGNRAFIDFSKKAWDDVVDPVLEQVEKVCRCGGDIYVPNYVCENCEATIIDLAMTCEVCRNQGLTPIDDIVIDAERQVAICQTCDTEWSMLESMDENLASAVNEKYNCQECNHVGYPAANLLCTSCDSPDPMELFDSQFTIKKISEEKTSGLEITNWEIKDPDPRLFDPEFQGAKKGCTQEEREAAEGVVARHRSHIDLDKIFPILSTREQASILGKPDPFSEEDAPMRNQNTEEYDDA